MKIIIDIPEGIYKHTQEYEIGGFSQENDAKIFTAIKHGTPLPKGHGRLGDLDALYQEIETKGWFDSDDAYYGGGLEDIVLSAPTLIEADKEEQNERLD